MYIADPIVERRPRETFYYRSRHLLLYQFKLPVVDVLVCPFHYVSILSAIFISGKECLSFVPSSVEPFQQANAHTILYAIGRTHLHSRHEGVSDQIELLAALYQGTKARNLTHLMGTFDHHPLKSIILKQLTADSRRHWNDYITLHQHFLFSFLSDLNALKS